MVHRSGNDAPVLVTAFNGRVCGVDRSDGRELWAHDLGRGGGVARLFVTDRRVYAGSTRLVAVEYPSGRLIWSATPAFGAIDTLLVDDDRLYIGTRGELECFSLDGRSLWRNPLQGHGYGTMALGRPGLVVQGDRDS